MLIEAFHGFSSVLEMSVWLMVPLRTGVQVINEIADNYNYGVIREYVGHGVGRHFHSAPTIQHFRNNNVGTMQPWQTFTIEPMLVQVSSHCTAGARLSVSIQPYLMCTAPTCLYPITVCISYADGMHCGS
jgi:methionine aminopeptidase